MKTYELTDVDNRIIEKYKNSIVDLSHQGIVILNSQGLTIYLNKSYCDIVGNPSSELIGYLPPFIKDSFIKKESRMMVELSLGNSWISEFKYLNNHDILLYISCRVVPIKSGDDPYIYICYFNDITEKINIEKKLIENNKELTSTIKSLKDAQSNMIQQEQLAGIGQLSAGVAHELNNPLGFVRSNINVLSEYVQAFKEVHTMYEDIAQLVSKIDITPDGELSNKISQLTTFKEDNEIEYLLSDIEDLVNESIIGIDRASKIVEALRKFSRKSANNDMESYDINEGIDTTLLISKNHWKYDIEITKDLGFVPNIYANGNEINQVFLNMIVNSVHAINEKKEIMGKFQGKIKIKSYSDEHFVYIEISDNGIGIKAENLSQIFNPFFTTKPVGKGTGLGLNISYNIIVTKHSGNISVTSEPGQGSLFRISLPIIERTDPSEDTHN